MNYENFLIREMNAGPVRWCSACERDAEDCVCEELSDFLRETAGNTGEDVCVPASPVPRNFNTSEPLVGNGSDTLVRGERLHASAAVGSIPIAREPLLLRYPVWDMSFSEYGNANGWEVPQ